MCPEALFAEFFSKNHIIWHCERKISAGFVRTAFYFSEELSSKTVLLYYSLPDSSSMVCQNCILRVQRKFLRNFIHRIILVGTVSEKKSADFDRFAFFFSGELLSKKFSFSSPCQILQAWVAKTVFYVSSGTFCGIFFRRIILIGTVSEKIQLLLSQLHSTFPGNIWANNSRSCPFGFFSSPSQILQAWVAELYSMCPEALFAEFFSKNHIIWHCERKNSAGFVRTAFYFSEELSSKTVLLYYSLPDSSSMGCQNCIPRVQRRFLRNFFHRIILIGTVSEKIQLVLSELHSTFPRNFRAKQFSFTIPCQILQAWVAKIVFYVSRGNFCGILFTESY